MRVLVLLLALAAFAPLVAGDAVVPAAAEASAPPVVQDAHWPHATIENEVAKVELSTYRASISKMFLLSQHPLALPKWRSSERSQADTKQPLPVLDSFNPDADMHSFVEGMELPRDPGQEGPWTPKQISLREIEYRLERGGLTYVMRYAMDEKRPEVHVTLTVRNGRLAEVPLMPRVRAIDGVHQDDPIQEAGYEKWAVHAGGEQGTFKHDSFPAVGVTVHAPSGLAALDYAAVKTRFFAAWWTSTGVRMGDGAGAAAAPAPHSVDVSWTGFMAPGPAGNAHQAMMNIVYGAPPAADGLLRPLTLKPGGELSIAWSIAVSVMTKDELGKLAPTERQLEYTDSWYAFFKSLANIMTWALAGIAAVVHYYGLSVIILTFLLKALLHRFTYKQYESTMKMQKLAPELKYLQEQYKGDRQKLAAKQMELWKKNGVNPLGGCLPVLIQMPIFIALYQSFCHSAEMRGQSFLWIRDLTLPDQAYWYLGFTWPVFGVLATINPLPLIYIAVTVWMSMIQKPPTGGDPQQEQMFKMMRWLPVIFGVIFYNMPSGLVLYFTVQAVLSTLEIKLVKKRLGMA